MNEEHVGGAPRLAVTILVRVGLPLASAMWLLATFSGGGKPTKLSFATALIAGTLLIISLTEASEIVDEQLKTMGAGDGND